MDDFEGKSVTGFDRITLASLDQGEKCKSRESLGDYYHYPSRDTAAGSLCSDGRGIPILVCRCAHGSVLVVWVAVRISS